MHYSFGLVCVCALGLVPAVACSETTGSGGGVGAGGAGGDGGTGGSGRGGNGGTGGARWDDWFWGERCPGCRCEGDPSEESFHTTLECLCCKYLCEPGPFPGATCVYQTITEYDCDRRVVSEEIEEWREFVIDTTTDEVVYAMFTSDYGICISHGLVLSAGYSGLEGCEVTSERTCDGCCSTGGAGGGDMGAFEVQPEL